MVRAYRFDGNIKGHGKPHQEQNQEHNNPLLGKTTFSGRYNGRLRELLSNR